MHLPPMHLPPMHLPPMHLPPMHLPLMHLPPMHLPPMHAMQALRDDDELQARWLFRRHASRALVVLCRGGPSLGTARQLLQGVCANAADPSR